MDLQPNPQTFRIPNSTNKLIIYERLDGMGYDVLEVTGGGRAIVAAYYVQTLAALPHLAPDVPRVMPLMVEAGA